MPALRSVSSGRPGRRACCLGPGDSLRLSATAVLVVLAGDRGEHVEHHGIRAANMRAVNSSPGAASCQVVGRSRATTRMCLAPSSARSLRESGSDRRERPSTCSTNRRSPGRESAMSRNDSGRASLAQLSFSTCRLGRQGNGRLLNFHSKSATIAPLASHVRRLRPLLNVGRCRSLPPSSRRKALYSLYSF
jgi:hypothetical protein